MKKLMQFGISVFVLATAAAAQTNVTTSGTTSSGTVPVFNGTATVTNSPITVSGSNVGIGTTALPNTLSVAGTVGISGTLGGASMTAPLNFFNFTPTVAGYDSVPVINHLFNIAPTPDPVRGWNGYDATMVGMNVDLTGFNNANAATYAALFQGGNVGIGTATPTNALSVVGSIGDSGTYGSPNGKSTPDNIFTMTPSFTGWYSAPVTNMLLDIAPSITGGWSTGNVSFVGVNVDLTGVSGQALYPAIFQGGNVGIGTASPGFPLTVNGSASASAYCINGANCITAWPSGSGSIGLTTNGTSGPATLSGNVLNIPQYSSGGASGAPASPANSFQFNNGGTFGAVSQWLYDPNTGTACNQLALTACDGLAASLGSELIYNTDTYAPMVVSDNPGGSGVGANPAIVFAGLDGTYASPAAAIPNLDSLGELVYLGYDGSQYDFSGAFVAGVDQGVTTGYVPSYLDEYGFTQHWMQETWNNANETFNGIDLEIANTASASNSSAIYVHNVSTNTDIFSVQPNGNGGFAGTLTAIGFPAWSGGSTATCWNTAGSTSSCGGGALSVLAGNGLSGGGTVSLGGSTSLSLPAVGTAGTYGSATQVPVITTDAYGRITGVTNTTITGTSGGSSSFSGLTNPTANLALSTGSYTTTFTAGAATGSSNLYSFTDTAFNTGTGNLMLVGTATNSTLNPFAVYAAGGTTPSLQVLATGNVGIGTTAPGATLEVNGNVKLTSGSGASVTYADGTTQTTAWNGVLNGGDYAEDMRATGKKEKYEPGDVLVLAEGDNTDVQKSVEPYSTMVAGIYATKPGVVGRRNEVAKSADNVPMAMVGVVPTKVSAENGPIHKGDLLVTASMPGYAMKGTDRNRMLGAVLGKAMGSLDSGTGVIEVLVTLQ